jgi:fructoselysine-6-P-deglycase FrlB-like protein
LKGQATLLSVSKELKEQPSLLRSFLRSAPRSEAGEGSSLAFVGAGDSYAASLCASFVAGPKVLALDPYSLAESIGWARGRSVYIISISGETRSNVELARALKGIAKRTVAITCNRKSRLAAAVDTIVELPFRPQGKSPGIASFTLSLSAALSVCGFDLDCDFEEVLSRATATAERIRIATRRDVTHFTGNNEAYAASIYGAAKIYELVGGRAQASLLEEFSHMPLFSLSTSDSVNVIDAPRGQKGEQLHDRLKKGGYASSLIRLEGGMVERVYLLVFALQMAALRAAKREGLKVPYFLGAKDKLRISDEMIY